MLRARMHCNLSARSQCCGQISLNRSSYHVLEDKGDRVDGLLDMDAEL
jgi:hypothetical protein